VLAPYMQFVCICNSFASAPSGRQPQPQPQRCRHNSPSPSPSILRCNNAKGSLRWNLRQASGMQGVYSAGSRLARYNTGQERGAGQGRITPRPASPRPPRGTPPGFRWRHPLAVLFLRMTPSTRFAVLAGLRRNHLRYLDLQPTLLARPPPLASTHPLPRYSSLHFATHFATDLSVYIT